jgi:hypothetical protein
MFVKAWSGYTPIIGFVDCVANGSCADRLFEVHAHVAHCAFVSAAAADVVLERGRGTQWWDGGFSRAAHFGPMSDQQLAAAIRQFRRSPFENYRPVGLADHLARGRQGG